MPGSQRVRGVQSRATRHRRAAPPPAAARRCSGVGAAEHGARSGGWRGAHHARPFCLSESLRGFFETCFPTLLRAVFGFDGACWLTAAAADPRLADALLRLLHPSGLLLTAARLADDEGAVLFAFPAERLPVRTQALLASRPGRATLSTWPQYRRLSVDPATGRPAVLLDVFSYYVFWAAYFAAGPGGGGGSAGAARAPPPPPAPVPAGGALTHRARAALLEPVRARLTGHGSGGGGRGCGPYQRLLTELLAALLPHDGATGAASPPLRLAGGDGGASAAALASHAGDGARGRVLASTLAEFWLADPDVPDPPPSTPGAVNGGGGAAWSEWAPGAARAGAPLRAFPYEPPGEEEAASVATLATHVTTDWGPGGVPAPALARAPWLPALPPAPAPPPGAARRSPPPPRLGPAAGDAAQAFGRSLYRFLSRAVAGWPPGRPLAPVVDVWLAAAAPWAARAPRAAPPRAAGGLLQSTSSGLKSHISSLAHEIARRPSSGGGSGAAPRADARAWAPHLLAFAPLWTGLLPPFAALVASRAAVDGPAALADLTRVLRALAGAEGAVDLLAAAEAAAAAAGGPGPAPAAPAADVAALADVAPFLVDAAAEWEATANAGSAAAAAAASPRAPAWRPFGAPPAPSAPPPAFGSDANSAAARVRDALAAAEGASRGGALAAAELAAARSAAAAALGRRVAGAAGSPGDRNAPPPDPADDAPVPGALAKARPGVAARYRGDWARRPVGAREVGPLVTLTLAASDAINAGLGLGPGPDAGGPAWLRAVPAAEAARRRARAAGWRVNLRPLAETATLAWLVVGAWVVGWVLPAGWRTLTWLFSDPYPSPHAAGHHHHHHHHGDEGLL